MQSFGEEEKMSVAASFLGLPRPAGGSGCIVARRSARPCGAFSAWVCGFAAPLSIPQPDLIALRGFAAYWTYLVLLFLLKQTGLYYFGAEEKQWAQKPLFSGHNKPFRASSTTKGSNRCAAMRPKKNNRRKEVC
ncbi:hypothetical protein [Saprospira grandis]|uniref:Uncharacterized protein n=1 Tax=Saprospira grandis (strain Lewin) TaxID=984262 RepID=H6L373_SAPGL|nr:hypothetical protein [Saprospira grandis]AFC24900.1 hypothetical protein SGRA_2171 [Saprospira grandis str. Lewin]